MHLAYQHKYGHELKVNHTEKHAFGHTSKVMKHDLENKMYEKHVVLAPKHNIHTDYEQQD